MADNFGAGVMDSGENSEDSPPWRDPPEETPPLPSKSPAISPRIKLASVMGLTFITFAIVVWGLYEATKVAWHSKTRPKVPDTEGVTTSGPNPSALNPQGKQDSQDPTDIGIVSQVKPQIISTHDALQRARTIQLSAQVKVVMGLLEKLEQQQKRWQNEVEPLLENEAGRRIAANQEAVRTFRNVYRGERTGAVEVAGIRSAARALAEPIEMVLADKKAVLDENTEFKKALSEIESQLRETLSPWRKANAMVQVLVKESTSREPTTEPLRGVMESLETAELRHRAQQVAAKTQEAEDVLIEELAASQTRLNELDARKQLAEEDLQATHKEAHNHSLNTEQLALAKQIAAARKKAKRQLELQADLPEIRSTLVPFITHGHKQLQDGEWVYLEEKEPISLKGLQAAGVLKDEQMSFQRLYFIGGGRENDRPNGPFRSYIGGHIHDPDMPLVRKVQRLLLSYGDLLVDLHMLSP